MTVEPPASDEVFSFFPFDIMLRSMLGKRRAIEIGQRGGRARARSLSPERRREIATWARFIRRQKEHGEAPLTERAREVILLVRVENPDLAALLKVISKLPAKYSQRFGDVLSDEEKQTIERVWQSVISEGNT